MENLQNIPETHDSQNITPEENETMDYYLGNLEDSQNSKDDTTAENTNSVVKKNKKPVNWKVVGVAVVGFVLLANPFIDNALSKIPKMESNINRFFFKFIFFLTMVILSCFFL